MDTIGCLYLCVIYVLTNSSFFMLIKGEKYMSICSSVSIFSWLTYFWLTILTIYVYKICCALIEGEFEHFASNSTQNWLRICQHQKGGDCWPIWALNSCFDVDYYPKSMYLTFELFKCVFSLKNKFQVNNDRCWFNNDRCESTMIVVKLTMIVVDSKTGFPQKKQRITRVSGHQQRVRC